MVSTLPRRRARVKQQMRNLSRIADQVLPIYPHLSTLTLFCSLYHGHKLCSFGNFLHTFPLGFVYQQSLLDQFGGPLAVSVFLIVLSAAGEQHLQTVWRVCFGFGILLPLTVLVFRLRMLSSKLYRKGAIKRNRYSELEREHYQLIIYLGRVPYWLVVKRYWRSLIGTCGAWCELRAT